MENQQKIILKDGLQVGGATLLTAEEAKLLPRETLKSSRWWWLRSCGSPHKACNVFSDGLVYCIGSYTNSAGTVRPALEIDNLESSNFKIWDKFRFGDNEFEIVLPDRALCTESIGYSVFRKDWETADANIYEASDVKKFVDEWYLQEKLYKIEKIATSLTLP